MRKTIIILAALMAAPTAQAESLTNEQRNLIKHMADTVAIAEKCPKWQSNAVMFNLSMKVHGIPDGAFERPGLHTMLALTEIKRAQNDLAESTEETACAMAMVMFGPEGLNVPNFMVEAE